MAAPQDEANFHRSPLGMQGRLERPAFASECLQGNPLGDPSVREVTVYLPPQVVAHPDRDWPTVLLLSAFTGTPDPLSEAHPWKRGALWVYDEQVAAGKAQPAIVCAPNTFTRLGGSQFVNSSAVGSYQDYVLDEVLPWLLQRYPCDPKRLGVVGKSSGGFGALHLVTQRPGTFQAAASIAGDCHFPYLFAGERLVALREWQRWGGDPGAFLQAFLDHPKLSGDAHGALNLLAMAACYSPNPEAPLGFDLPIDLETGAWIEPVWQRWLAFDPVEAIPRAPEGVRQLDWLYLEAGTTDEFHLQFALRVLVQRLAKLEIPCLHHEFEGGHFGMDARYREVLPRLAQALHAL